MNDTQTPVPVLIRRNRPESPWTYDLLQAEQQKLAAEIRDHDAPGALLLNELAPVITFGKRATTQELKMPVEFLNQAGIEVLATDRGGLATYHGPGQWVLFAVDRLDRLTGDPRGVRKAVEALLNIALEVGRPYAPSAEIREGAEMGVWTSQGKFASVGVHIEQGVLLHGLSVNGFKTPTSFMGLRPCGLDAPVDFLLPNPSDAEFEKLGQQLVTAAFRHFYRSG
ncbi:hypothetical protein WDW37_10245 [Bdellovibrionota bacterium FG-1]